MTLFAVAFGGATGAIARYLLSGWVQATSGGSFPWGTLLVNVSGCLALGFVAVWLQTLVSAESLRALLAIGFLGSFTTFSAFSFEALTLLRAGEWWRAGSYTLGSVAIGIVAVALGVAVAGWVFQRPS